MARRELTELPDLPDPAEDTEDMEDTEDPGAKVAQEVPSSNGGSSEEPEEEVTVEPEDLMGPDIEPGTDMLHTQLVQTQQELTSYKEKWQRTLADFDNYRRRTERDRKLDHVRGQARLMSQLLEVLDTFDKALDAECTTVDQARDGIILILTQMTRVLKEQGLEPVPSVGQPFDNRVHEALTTIETDEVAHDIIVEETTRGYTLKGQLLRTAKVIVAQAPADRVSKRTSKLAISKKNKDTNEKKN